MKATEIKDTGKMYHCFDIWDYYIYDGKVYVFENSKLVESAELSKTNLGSLNFYEIQPEKVPQSVLNILGYHVSGSSLLYTSKRSGQTKKRFNGNLKLKNYEYVKGLAEKGLLSFNQQLDEIIDRVAG